MIIGVDATKIAESQRTGIGNTIFPILEKLKTIDTKNTYYLYTNRPLPKAILGKNFIERLIPFPKFWHTVRLPLALREDKPDMFIELTNKIPSFAPKNTIVMIHDFAFKYFPECYSLMERFQQDFALKKAIAKASHIILTSKANQIDFNKFFNETKSKISVIPLGYNDQLHTKYEIVKIIPELNAPYFLSVGRLEKRKNTINIVKAFEKFKEETNSAAKLVLVGKNGYGFREISKTISKSKFKSDIIRLGFLPDLQLSYLYSNALALVYPSLYEGFGFPILEAMSCGTPVLTSNVPTTEEVAKDGALLVDPSDVKEICDGMVSLYKSQELRSKLISQGKEVVKQYSWLQTALKIKELIDE